ncbi:circularly permuted type 2 ATP-grasp protein [Isoptericola chiayiensis]|uniref:Circularly permuted type 2 ATP-grasp protein n=1 Tax=Isoptericola chiayiensis TaxID=579446 RepID=A0ABP8YI43_9MICO|nr:circularly permuted type 2 ATP-grasp protein [Isoptericola chiayiensis]NOW00359.1 putative circularly permuted ATP-grasp superfamily protein [Isoptericola chiayiensis]
MADLFDDYPLGAAFDELLDRDRAVRPRYGPVQDTLASLRSDEVSARAEALGHSYLAQGITFDVAGEERPFPLDVVPRVVEPGEWDRITRGVQQRVRTLEAFLADVYGPQEAVRDGVVPRRLVLSSREFQREAHGIEPPNGVRCHVAGVDLVRDEAGEFRVLEDNVRVPSGVSYVLANRQAMVRTFPELFSQLRVRSVVDYPRRLRAALVAAAPDQAPDPTVVVLTPGVYNSAYYEHALLARLMGVELVEGRDLYCASGRVYMRTTAGPQRVDVVYRRVDDVFLDPVRFRADSVLGVPGLVDCARRGTVTLANAIGNGVADDKLVYSYLPDLTRYYLGEEPVLANVDTWRLEEPGALAEVLDRLDELVVKPVDGSGGKGIVVGPDASRAELATLRGRLIADPRGWVAQPLIQLSTAPTYVDGAFRPRHVDLRPFAVNDGEDVWVLPGGLTRVALAEGQLVVNSSQGGGSKDTWVLEPRRGPLTGELAVGRDDPEAQEVPDGGADPADAGVPIDAHPADVAGVREQQQQQQQQRARESRHLVEEVGSC